MIVSGVHLTSATRSKLAESLAEVGCELSDAPSPNVVLTDLSGSAELAELRSKHPQVWLVQVVGQPLDQAPDDAIDDVWVLSATKHELALRLRVAKRQTVVAGEREWYRSLLQTAHVGVFRTDSEKLSYVNDALWQMMEYDSASELVGQSAFAQYANPGEGQALVELLSSERSVRAVELTAITKHGRHKRLLLSATRSGHSVVGLAVDITRVQRVEADLRASEELIKRLLDAVPGGVVFVGLDGSVGMGNREAQRVLGLSFDELSQRFVTDFETQTLREDGSPMPAAEYPVSAALTSGEAQPPMVVGVQRPDGEVSWAIFRAVPVRDPDSGENTGALVTLLDITARKQAEEQVRRSESRYRELVQRSPDPISIIVGGRIAFANQAAMELVRASSESQVLGKSVYELFEPTRRSSLAERARQLVAGASLPAFEERLLRLDGTEAWVELAATAVSFEGAPALFVSSRDVTARRDAETKLRRYEAQMQHTQKLESLGILAGGIAHDFNNLLVAIVGNADLARLRLSETSPALECLDRIQAAAQRATDLTNQMLAYSGKSRFIVTDVDLSALVLEMSDLLGSVISKKATLHRDLASDLPSVEADPAQLGQVVMNLITNASDSLEGKPGDVYVSTRLVDVDRGFLQQTYLDEGLPEGRYICLEVRDTGCGMDDATRSRIFDPFFTTKATGRGLGLAATLGIVRGHRGAMRIDTEPGAGTLFRIYFPCSNTPSSRSTGYSVKSPPPSLHSAGVLVVDDEALILEVTRDHLSRLGLRVLTANSGREALELLERSEAKIAAVLLDMDLRDVSGAEVLSELCAGHPGLRIVLTSGYTEEEARERAQVSGALPQVSGFLQKPYTQEALTRAVTQALRPS